jgi:aquaporin Z
MATVGHVSGGHFNPAVSFGMAIAGRLPWRDVLPYWLAQLIGAAVTSVIVWAIIPTTFPALLQVADRGAILGRSANGFGSHSPLATLTQGQSEFSLLSALLVEVIATAVFVGIFLAATGRRSERLSPAVVVGLGFGALTILAWPVTNAGLNPARSLASVLMAGEGSLWGQYWVFFVAPLVGGGLAALFWRAFAPVPVADDELEDETDEVDEPELEVVEPVEAPRPVDPTSLVPPVEPVATEPVTPEPVTPAEAVAPAEPAEPAEPGVEGTDAPKKPGEPQA